MTTESKKVGPNSEVVMHLSITLEDGTVADTTRNRQPARVHMGSGALTKGLEEKIIGLAAGDKVQLKVEPEDGFGYPDPNQVFELPRASFPSDIELEEGVIIAFAQPDGAEVPGVVRAIEGDNVKVDFNHPLSGHNLIFDIEILSVDEISKNETH